MGEKLNELALFAGAGGGILGGKLIGWRTVCAVEYEPHAAAILAKRQNDGFLEPFPIWDDVRSFDGKPWRGIVDVVSGGFPCQDISSAGSGKGIEGERSGLWSEMARIIREVQPKIAFMENSPMLTIRGLGTVLGDLAEMGYDARWGVLSGADIGAPHKRERIWIVAHSNLYGWKHETSKKQGGSVTKRDFFPQWWGELKAKRLGSSVRSIIDIERLYPPGCCGMDDGMADGVDRIKRIGNGQIPAVVKLAWENLSAGFNPPISS